MLYLILGLISSGASVEEFKFILKEINAKTDRLMQLSEKQSEKLSDHDVKLATYNTLLEEHIRRTELLEHSLDGHKKQSQENQRIIQAELEPILEREKVKNYLKRWLLGAGAMAGALYAIAKFYELL